MASNAAALVLGGAAAQLAFITIEIVIARHFLSGDYGIFSTVQALALTGLIVLDFGMHWWAIESGSSKPSSIPVLLGTTVVLKLLAFVALWPIATLGLWAVGYDERTVSFFALFFLFTLTMAVQDSLAAAHTAQQRMAINALFQGGVALVIAAFVAIAILSDKGLFGVGVSYVLGGLVVTCVWWWVTSRRTRPRVLLASSKEIIRNSYQYGLTGMLVHIFRKGDIILLSVFSTMPQVGIYAAAAKLLDLAYKIPMLGTLVVSPEMFKQNSLGGTAFRHSADLFLRFNVVLGLLIAVGCYHISEWLILTLFGPDYRDSILVLRILCASFALKFIHYSLQTILTTGRKHTVRTKALSLATGLAIVGYIVLIPLFGAKGAAATVVFSEIVLSVLYIIGVGDPELRGVILRRIAVAIVVAFLAIAIPGISSVAGLSASILSVAFCLFAFAAFGFITKSELQALSIRFTRKDAR